MNTPSARSARINPTVHDPMSSVMAMQPPLRRQRDVPENAAGERALAGPYDRPRVAEQVQDRLDPAGLEQVRDRRRQLDRAARERPVRDDRRVKVALQLGASRPRERPDKRCQRRAASRVATPTTRAVLRLCSGSGVSESQLRTPGWANGRPRSGCRPATAAAPRHQPVGLAGDDQANQIARRPGPGRPRRSGSGERRRCRALPSPRSATTAFRHRERHAVEHAHLGHERAGGLLEVRPSRPAVGR